MNDKELLQQFVADESQEAFRKLVERYTPLVFSSAYRRVGTAAAEDVVQVVFMILAKKAKRLSHRRSVKLSGWLFNTTRFVSLAQNRERARRRAREQKAQISNEMEKELHSLDELRWQELSPVLDASLDRLSARDREAVVMRYLEGATFKEVANRLGVSENTATKRVGRAVDRMRGVLIRMGREMPLAALTGLLASHATEAAAVHVSIDTISTMALAGGTPAVGVLLQAGLRSIVLNQLRVGAVASLSVGTSVAITATATVYGVQAMRAASLPFEVVKVQPLTLCYIGRATLPDGSEAYQVNSRGDRLTHIVRPGDRVEGLTVAAHTNVTEKRERQGVGGVSVADASVLELVSSDRSLELVKRRPMASGADVVHLRGRQTGRRIEVRSGESFNWGNRQYEVVRVDHARQRLRVLCLPGGPEFWLPVKE